jgi:branched-chain amino acid transport system ATP-binding protein
MLEIDQLRAGYGGGTVLHGITLAVEPGQVHTVIGANGAGKTTLLHTIAGLLRPTGGRILLGGHNVTTATPQQRARAGLALVPQGRRLFPSLTVDEHLRIAHRSSRHGDAPGWSPARVLQLLPQLAARRRHRGGQLSGGEQQMLAIARALLIQPRALLLDEPTEGLAPILAARIQDLIPTLADGGLTILLTSPSPDPAAAAEHTTLVAGRHTTTGGPDRQPPAVPATGRLCQTSTAPPPRPRPAWADLPQPPEPAPAHTDTGHATPNPDHDRRSR